MKPLQERALHDIPSVHAGASVRVGVAASPAAWGCACALVLSACLPSFPNTTPPAADGAADTSVVGGEAGGPGEDGALDARGDGPAAIGPGADGGADAACPSGTSPCAQGCVALDAATSCGSCSNDCTKSLTNVASASVGCRLGHCSYQCASGYADCADAGTGCATSLTQSGNCGACGVSCDGGTACGPLGDGGAEGGSDAGASAVGPHACLSTCPLQAPTLCASQCVNERDNPQTNAANCGGCGAQYACTGGKTCQAGACACPSTAHDCGGTCVAFTSTSGCGGLCSPCPSPAHGTATCDGTMCGVSCDPGYSLCGDVCVDEKTDNANCGGCGTPCAGTCTNGVCVLNMGQSGCTTDATCVPGGCFGGVCLGAIGVAGQVACGSSTCPTNPGCSYVCSPGSSTCATPPTCRTPQSGESYVACDAPNDCPVGQDCCLTYTCGQQTTQQCYPRSNTSVAGSGCPAAAYCMNVTLVCDPKNPVCTTGTCKVSSGDSYSCE